MKSNIIKNYKFILGIISQASSSRVKLNILFTVIGDFFSIFYNILFLAYFMNVVEKGASIIEVLKILMIVIGINIVFEIANCYYNQAYIPKDDVKISLYLRNMIYKKITTTDIECFDNPDYYDNITFALNDLYDRVRSILNNISQFVSHLFCMFVLIGYFTQVDFTIVMISLISVLLGLFFEPIVNKYRFRYNNESVKYERRFDYLKRISIQSEYAQELRTTNVKNALDKLVDDSVFGLQTLLNKYYKKITLIDSVQVFFGFGIVSCITTLISVYKMVVLKSISIAMFLPLLGGIAQFTWRASSVIRTYNSILNDNIYLNRFNEFYQHQEKIVSLKNDKVAPEFSGIKLDHLYFSYDDKDNYILKDICMEIQPKQKIALVGYNGAGKSTLINLILRLYDPSRGSITYNNKNIKDYNEKEYRGKYGIVFQDINIYATSISENIALDTKVYSIEEMENVMKALRLSEKINHYKEGFDTQLTHELSDSGEVLSQGQCQCLALARVFINPNTQIYIFDEPTSALDPIAEEKIFEIINTYLTDKTVIYISHRFSASKIADNIFFMEDGKINEQGNHDELIVKNGKYAEMFNLQAKYYREDVEN